MSFSLLSPLVWDDDFFGAVPGSQPARRGGAQQSQGRVASWPPRMDIVDKGDKMMLALELPGVKKDAVSVELHNNIITISGTLPKEIEKEQGAYRLQERRTGSFERSIRVPQGLKSEELQAKMEDGVLYVEYPAQPKETETKKISIA